MNGLIRLFGAVLLAVVASVAIDTTRTASADDLSACEGGSPSSAIDACTNIIDAGSQKGRALAAVYYNRGVSYAAIGDVSRAIADWSTAIRLKPDFAEAYFDRGLTYAKGSDADRAIADFDMDIRLRPDHAVAYYARGVAYEGGKGDLTRALADYKTAARLLSPDDPLRNDALRSIDEIEANLSATDGKPSDAFHTDQGSVCSMTASEVYSSPLCVRYLFECQSPPADYVAYLDAIPFNQRMQIFWEKVFELAAQKCKYFSYPDAEAALKVKRSMWAR